MALGFCSFHPCVMVYSLKISPAQMHFKTMLITWPEGVKGCSHAPFSLYTRTFSQRTTNYHKVNQTKVKVKRDVLDLVQLHL
jgi:hypothetical protein